MNTKPRYGLFDALRGFSLISMILYHATYDLVAIYGVPLPWFFAAPGYVWQQSICWGFIFLSGLCWDFSKNPLKRGLLLSFCGLLITIVTWFIMPSQVVFMGVLSFLGAATLLMIPVNAIVQGLRPGMGLFLSALLFIVTRNVNQGSLGFEGFNIAPLPNALYEIKGSFIWGFPPAGFYSSDYFSVLPWFFLFLSGYFFWKIISKKAKVSPIVRANVPLLGAIGRKSLGVYLLHQPLLLLILWLVMR